MAGERRLLIDCPPRRRVAGVTIFPTPACKKPPRAACLTGARPQNDGCMNDRLELISFGKVSASAGVSIGSHGPAPTLARLPLVDRERPCFGLFGSGGA